MNPEEILSEIENSNEPAGLMFGRKIDDFSFYPKKNDQRTALSALRTAAGPDDVLKKSAGANISSGAHRGQLRQITEMAAEPQP